MSFVSKIFRKKKIPTGRFTYRGEGKFKGLALQLRVEPNQKGLLIINANTVLYLNQTATVYAFYLMQGLNEDQIIAQITKTYKVKKQQAKEDFEELSYTISTLAQTEEIEPISYLNIEKIEPFSQTPNAPIRVDMALTFRCQNNCMHCYAGGPHETKELSTSQWKKIIDKLHQIEVFILTFTGGEPTLREDLSELLTYAQKKGLVTGLITNGRKLVSKNYVDILERSGLDFAQITLESHKPKIHNLITKDPKSWRETITAIKNLIPTHIYTTTNTTLNQHNKNDFLDTIDFIKELGVASFGCNSLIYSGKANQIAKEFGLSIKDLKEILPKIKDKAAKIGLKFLWYTPTQYCELDPIKLGLGIKSCSASMINICIAPNADVYPCQSYFESLGNILKNKWSNIWNNPLAKKIRNIEYVELKCKDCPQLQICGGGCPLELQSKNFICKDTK